MFAISGASRYAGSRSPSHARNSMEGQPLALAARTTDVEVRLAPNVQNTLPDCRVNSPIIAAGCVRRRKRRAVASNGICHSSDQCQFTTLIHGKVLRSSTRLLTARRTVLSGSTRGTIVTPCLKQLRTGRRVLTTKRQAMRLNVAKATANAQARVSIPPNSPRAPGKIAGHA